MIGIEKYLIGIIVAETTICWILLFKNRQLKKALKISEHNMAEIYSMWKKYTGIKDIREGVIGPKR